MSNREPDGCESFVILRQVSSVVGPWWNRKEKDGEMGKENGMYRDRTK